MAPDFKILPATVKFAARPSRDQAGMLDMVVDLPDGRTEKVFTPVVPDGAPHVLSGYDRGDTVLLVEAPTGHGGRMLFPAHDGTREASRYAPLPAADAQAAASRMAQFVALLKEGVRSAMGAEKEGFAVSEETARTIATTAFIQTLR